MSEQQEATFTVEKLYLKDTSLEIPHAPQVYLETESPQIEVNIHSQAAGLDAGMFEVVLTVTVTAKLKDKTVFLVEVAQAGIFQIRNIPDENMEAVIAITCPGVLLPYARETVSSLVMRAGFPPVVLQHVSFEALYQQRLQQQSEQAQQPQPADTPPQSH